MLPLKIVVCNIGSSSFKFQLLSMETETCLARGHVERVGTDRAKATFSVGASTEEREPVNALSQGDAVRLSIDFLTKSPHRLIRLSEIDGVGFKCIQAGELNGSVLLTESVLAAMEQYSDLAPAHNPPYIRAIRMFSQLMPETPLVGVFEPGFHADAPTYAKIYGTPIDWIEDYGIRRYGYHGASHRFVTGEVVKRLGLPSDRHKIITCHLGGSSSVCAFQDGKAIDTSMGFSPQSGLVQGTRVGDMDPFVLPYIMKRKGISLEEALGECSRNAGLAGLSGTSGDMRDIIEAIRQGSTRARLARDKFIYDIKRYIGEYIVLMEGLDAIAFTGGIGQRDADLRRSVLTALSFLGLKIDLSANALNEQVITTDRSRIAALVLETNEEIVVARETARVVSARA